MQALRQQLGQDYKVEPGRHDDVFSVSKGITIGAKVHIKQDAGTTQFHVHGTGIIIGRLINQLSIARRVASAIANANLG